MNTNANDLRGAHQNDLTEDDKKSQFQRHKHILAAIMLQIVVIMSILLLWVYYHQLHDMEWPVASVEDIASYDFVGVEPDNPQPSPLAVLNEVIVWSLLGVMARSEFHITYVLARGKEFGILENISRLIGDHAMGSAIAVAVVALLRSTEVTIAQVSLTLGTANIESIIAISFILGFYHEHTRQLLGTFRGWFIPQEG